MQEAERKAAHKSARPGVERGARPILAAPRSNGLPGPLPAQGDWTDPRWRPIYPGAVSETIPYQKPGWTAPRDWDAYRKAVARGSSYTVVHKVVGTYESMRRYLRHLQEEREEAKADQLWKIELEELDALIARAREIRGRIERAAMRMDYPQESNEVAHWVDVHEVVFPAASVSRQLRAMIEAGVLPGLSLDAERNVVRITRVLRYCEASA